MDPLQVAKAHVMRDLKQRGFKLTDISGLPFRVAFWAKHPAGENFLMFVEVVEGRSPKPLTRDTRTALFEHAKRRGACVWGKRVWLTETSEIKRIRSKRVR